MVRVAEPDALREAEPRLAPVSKKVMRPVGEPWVVERVRVVRVTAALRVVAVRAVAVVAWVMVRFAGVRVVIW